MGESGFDLMSWGDFERMEGSGGSTWMLARRSLGVSSFGMNMVEIAPGGQIPEHDETERDQEEVFVVWEGDATAVIDGADHPAPRGSFVRLDPDTRRTIRNDGASPVRILAVSAPRSSGYEDMGWG
ncbi:MAG: cupin domain-containing protein [Solirubrobacterales bacterium]